MNVQAAFRDGLDQTGDTGAGVVLFRGRDGIFEVEDERVGSAIFCPRELAFGVAGNEQERAQSHIAFRKVRPLHKCGQRVVLYNNFIKPIYCFDI